MTVANLSRKEVTRQFEESREHRLIMSELASGQLLHESVKRQNFTGISRSNVECLLKAGDHFVVVVKKRRGVRRTLVSTLGTRGVAGDEKELTDGFVPSAELTGLWVSGVKRRLRQANRSDPTLAVPLNLSTAEIRADLGRKITEIIAVLGFRQQHGIHDFHEFAGVDRFNEFVADEFLNRLPVSTTDAGLFLALLHKELVAYLLRGQISGNWGRLNLCGREIVLENKEPTRETISSYFEADEV